jgi:hypothetical protein
MKSASRVFFLAVFTVALGGCKYWMAGHNVDYSLIVTGEGIINTADHTSTYEFTIDGSNVKCSGKTVPTLHKPEIVGSTSRAEASCSDGRKGTGELLVTSMEGGTGTGTDDCGNTIQLVWGINEYNVQRSLEAFRRTRNDRKVAAADKCDATDDAPPHRDPLI